MNGEILSIEERQVVAFLKRHPQFFAQHLDLLETMQVPHPSGQAVSLISKQLELSRQKYQDLECQFSNLIEIARENDVSFGRLHLLTLALLSANDVVQLLDNLTDVLHKHFGADAQVLKISYCTESASNFTQLQTHPGEALHIRVEELLSGFEPQSGSLDATGARIFFADQASKIQSCAVIPLLHERLKGVLVIGSQDASRFQNNVGSHFLNQISEILLARLLALM